MLEPEGLEALVRTLQPSAEGSEFLDDLYWHLSSMMAHPEKFDDDVSAALLEFNGV